MEIRPSSIFHSCRAKANRRRTPSSPDSGARNELAGRCGDDHARAAAVAREISRCAHHVARAGKTARFVAASSGIDSVITFTAGEGPLSVALKLRPLNFKRFFYEIPEVEPNDTPWRVFVRFANTLSVGTQSSSGHLIWRWFCQTHRARRSKSGWREFRSASATRARGGIFF